MVLVQVEEHINTLTGVVNGTAESSATVTSIPDEYNSDSWFTTPTYIGAVSGATDTCIRTGRYLNYRSPIRLI